MEDALVAQVRKQVADRIKAQRKSFKASLAVKMITPKSRRNGRFRKFSLLK